MAVDKKHRDEQELERYGVWVKAGPDKIDEHDSQSLELMDIEDSGNDDLLITEEEEQLLGELEESALPDFSDFENSFDDSIDDTGLEDSFALSSEGIISDDPESKELLHKIEDDLSALREEIRQLKEELTGLRIPAVAPVATAEADDGSGFFEDEEDETIALTGDELDNILDSADMTEQDPDDSDDSAEIELKDEGITFDDEDSIDLSGDFTDLAENEMSLEDFGDFPIEETPLEEDPALSILGSPDEPGDEGDPDTIEIDIPGMDETIDLDESTNEEMDQFEEITNLDDFGLDDIDEISLDDIAVEEAPALEPQDEMIFDIGDELVLSESFDEEAFDEGEEVEIDLTEEEDILEAADDSDMVGLDMEDISLDDFGIEDLLAEEESSVQANTDVLAVEDDIEEIDLDEFGLDDVSDDDIEELELDSVLAEGIEEGFTSEESVELEASNELLVEEIDLEVLEPEAAEVDIIAVDFDEPEDLEIEEINFDDNLEFEELSILDEEDTADVELEVMELVEDEIALGEKIPEISIDEAIDEIEPAEEFSLEEEGDLIEDLEIEVDEGEEIQVTLPDDDFDELPGTEEVDLTSLEALAAAPDMTELAGDEIIDLPEIDFDDAEVLELAEEDIADNEIMDLTGEDLEINLDDEPTDLVEEITEFNLSDDIEELEETEPLVPTPQTIAAKAKAALEIDSLPGDLKNEIKEVLTYMDQLLESLPDDKIQEFARSEHFEVYKKIFEELGISD